MAAHFHIIWLIIFCVTIFFFRNHLNEFRTDSKARSTSEILKAVTGSFLDPGRSYIQSDDKFHSKGVRVGETLRFQIVSVDGSGSRHLINYDEGWDVSITGVATINPELESAKEGIYTYSCVMRKAGEYCIRIEFRGVQIRGSPFKLEIKPSSIDPVKCKLSGEGLGLKPLLQNEPSTIRIETFDCFENKRREGGDSENFTFQFREKLDLADGVGAPWEDTLFCQVTDNADGTYSLHYCVSSPGIYSCRVLYEDKVIQEEFVTCVLSEADFATINKGAKKRKIFFKITLEEQPKSTAWITFHPMTIVCETTKWKIFHQNFATLKLNRTIRVQLLPERMGDLRKIVISSPTSLQHITFFTNEATLVYGSFLLFLQNRTGNNIGTFEDRRKHLYSEIQKSHYKSTYQGLRLEVDREAIYKSMKKLATITTDDWKGKFRITFAGERGIDEGGLRREFLNVLSRDVFNPSRGLFRKLSDDRDILHPNYACTDLKLFELAGKLLAKCLYDTIIYGPSLVNIHFSRSFYKQMLDIPVHYSDFCQDDPQYFTSKIKYILDNPINEAGLDLFFVEEEQASSDGQALAFREIEIKPDGKNVPVTDQNKIEYLLCLADYRLHQKTKKQTQHFCAGFYSLIPKELLNLFDEQELELLITGLPGIPIEDMKRHTRYDRYSEEDKVIKWFWIAVENLNESERARLLQFITGSSQVPTEGFAAFQPNITISKGYTIGGLPVSHTCFNRIDLPHYSSYDQLQTKLLMAITECAEGFDIS